MALRIIDGFDYIPPGASFALVAQMLLAGGWYFQPGGSGYSVPGSYNGRFGGTCLEINQQASSPNPPNILRKIPGSTCVSGVVGVALQIGPALVAPFYIAFFDSSANAAQCSVSFHEYGIMNVWCGAPGSGTLLATAPIGTFVSGGWFYFEVEAVISATSGSLIAKINGVAVFSITGSVTQVTGHAYFDSILFAPQLTSAPTSYQIDDFYFLDLTGSVNNSFLGNVRVQTQFPAGAGATTDFTAVGASTNWQAASNTNLNDTTYNYDGTVGDLDLYAMGATVNAPLAYGVQVRGGYRQDDATEIVVVNVLRTGGTNYTGANYSLYETYTFDIDIWELDPNTSAGWTQSEINALQAGPKIISIG